MSGSDSSGVFSLRVDDATEADDAEFECQVGPAAGGNKPIRASARLKVLREYILNKETIDYFFAAARMNITAAVEYFYGF